MKKNYFLYFLPVIAFFTFSCKKLDITPAYLIFCSEDFIDSACVDVSNFNKIHDTNYDERELAILRQHTFKDVFVSINGNDRGPWTLPCTIPILPDYDHENKIRITPCVRHAGTTLTTFQYHFLKPIEQNIFLEKEEKHRISSIKFEYRDEISIPLLETFMQSTNFSSVADTILGAEMELVEENGKHLGQIILDDQHPYFNIATHYFYLNGRSTKQFWEFYYKSKDGEMTTYLNFQNTVTGVIVQTMVVFPDSKEEWKKAYIDITDIIYQACGTASQVSVRLGISGLRNANADKASFYFENVKLIVM
jgi:hypothetical protein